MKLITKIFVIFVLVAAISYYVSGQKTKSVSKINANEIKEFQ